MKNRNGRFGAFGDTAIHVPFTGRIRERFDQLAMEITALNARRDEILRTVVANEVDPAKVGEYSVEIGAGEIVLMPSQKAAPQEDRAPAPEVSSTP
ncbi:MAG TPA: hypothetical protein VJO33_02790 [Gemmatimonadaceae bacterium]|nr:hypothetical protein [Gemmatimonadaceae bacterium]